MIGTCLLNLGILIINNTTNTSVIKHALVPNGWVGGWLGGVVVGGGGGGRGAKAKVHSSLLCGRWGGRGGLGGGGGGGRGAKAKVHSTFWAVGVC